MMNIAWVLFEVAFPIGFVVSSIVTFVLIPFAKTAGLPIDNFFVTTALLMHNANIIFMTLEFVLNKVPFAVWHFPFIVLYGMAYIVFSWAWHAHTRYFHYFFLDYRRKGAVLWYLALMLVVALFFFMGYWCSQWMNSTDSVVPSLVSTSFVVRLTLLYCNRLFIATSDCALDHHCGDGAGGQSHRLDFHRVAILCIAFSFYRTLGKF